MALQLQLAAAEDAARLWNMQKIAFQKLLDKYQDFDTNPASEPLEKVSGRLAQKGRYYYFIQVNGEIAGAVSITDRKDGSAKRLAPIFLLPQYEGQGLAQEAIREVERIHGSHTWELDTILQEEKLCYLYEKMGYRRTGELTPVNDRMTLVFYEKE